MDLQYILTKESILQGYQNFDALVKENKELGIIILAKIIHENNIKSL